MERKRIIRLSTLIVFLLLIIEMYARFFTDDCLPWFDKDSNIVKRKRNTRGWYKTGNIVPGYFRINNEGWNSHRDYFKVSSKKTGSNIKRIAIVGHSNIEGVRVHINKTLSKIMEDELLKKNKAVEIYTFGYGGMHLAQALFISRDIIKNYQPDILIIGTLLDNFVYETTNKSYFMALNINENNEVNEIVPEKYSPLSFLYFSRALHIIDTRYKLGEKLRNPFSDGKGHIKREHYKSLQDPMYREEVICGLRYILNEFQKLSFRSPDLRMPVYFIKFPDNLPPQNKEITLPNYLVSHKNKVTTTIKNQGFFTVIDMTLPLSDNFKTNNQRFDFPDDGHYNEYAHQIIGQYLANYLLANWPLNLE